MRRLLVPGQMHGLGLCRSELNPSVFRARVMRDCRTTAAHAQNRLDRQT
jgi:hypothetical protein